MTIKIKIKVGEVEVEYEGAEAFLDKKLPGLISQLSQVAESVPTDGKEEKKKRRKDGGSVGTLASFLKDKKAGSSQNRRFLATSEWLHRKGKEMLNTGEITKALKNSHQSRLGNPSDTLNQNVSKGFCEKHGKDFFVTNEGRTELG